MLDRDADDRGARIVVGLREQPGDARLLAGQPVALGAGGGGVARRRGLAGWRGAALAARRRLRPA
jgi:hypothetical protein